MGLTSFLKNWIMRHSTRKKSERNYAKEAEKEKDKTIQGIRFPKTVVYCLKKFNKWPPTKEHIERIKQAMCQEKNASSNTQKLSSVS